MSIERLVFRTAGILILISLVLAESVSNYWLILSLLVGLNMVQASFTGFCPLVMLLKKTGMQAGPAFE